MKLIFKTKELEGNFISVEGMLEDFKVHDV